MRHSFCRCRNCITPPYLLEKLMESDDREIREAALHTIISTARLQGERSVVAMMGISHAMGNGRRTIFDCQNRVFLPSAVLARSEDGDVSDDESVNRAFDGFGTTRSFYKEVLDRNSLDDRGMRLDGYVHRGTKYNNAFWDGREMVFGDGDGVVFTDFTSSLDVIAHELSHGVTEFTAGLEYHFESGALNESMSDVFGSLVKQWSLQQTAEAADWLIGAEVFTPQIDADALRSMKAPGTAYDNPLFGKDPQPDHIRKFQRLPDTEAGDFGGVHINSGIPNKAFYLAAINIGGHSLGSAGAYLVRGAQGVQPDNAVSGLRGDNLPQGGPALRARRTARRARCLARCRHPGASDERGGLGLCLGLAVATGG